MVGLVIAVLVLLVLAYLAFTMLPPPFGMIVGAALVIILLIVLLEGLAGSGHKGFGVVEAVLLL
jgi:hypothetical protein